MKKKQNTQYLQGIADMIQGMGMMYNVNVINFSKEQKS